MAQEAAYSLSISDLLHVLNEKLGLESSKFRGISLPPTFSTSSLESEISSLEASARGVLRLVLSLRSISRPVNKLPPEILSYIARYITKDRDRDAISIVPLTHVCRYWRESIISAPGNWTLISGKNEDMATVCLQRAKAAPLEITLCMSSSSSFSNIFVSHFQTIRSLDIYSIPTAEELTNVFSNPLQSMPTLQSLELSRSVCEADLDRSIDPFVSFAIPALERLSLENIPLYPSLLGLSTLTEFTITDTQFDFHLDTLLNFLEGNPRLERVTLEVFFTDYILLGLQRKTVMRNRLRYLSICGANKMEVQALISNIPLQKGANLDLDLDDEDVTLNDFLPGISAGHLSSPPSPTLLELNHGPFARQITLNGPGGKLTFFAASWLELSFADLSVLPLANVREVRLCYWKEIRPKTFKPPAFYPVYFPALETLTVDCSSDVLGVLSILLSNSPPPPFLKTIGFLNCDLPEEVMEELTTFASERRNTPTSTWLHRVQIVHSDGVFPSAASIRRLREHVKVVETRIEDKFSTDLT